MYRNFKRLFRRVLNMIQSKSYKSGSYINAASTIEEANKVGLAVGDYVELIWDQKGGSSRVIDEVNRIIDLSKATLVVEIGGGTGRYIEKLLGFDNIKQVYSYETAEDWSHYLEKIYSPILIKRAAEGDSLKFEKDNSIDACFAHGVFVYLPFLNCLKYFFEMIRVTRPGGFMVFDVYLYQAFASDYLKKWLSSPDRYPVVFEKDFLIDFFRTHSKLIGEFRNKYGHSFSTYLIFKKND